MNFRVFVSSRFCRKKAVLVFYKNYTVFVSAKKIQFKKYLDINEQMMKKIRQRIEADFLR
jgi:hypothetical protein